MEGPERRPQEEGGWQGVSESAVSGKVLLGVSLARNRLSPKRPSEPRPSGVHPEEDVVEKRQRSFPLENDGWLLGMEVSTPEARTRISSGTPIA